MDMNKKIVITIIVIIIVFAMAIGVYLSHKPMAPEAKNRLYFGFDVRLSPKEDARLYEPFIEYLSKKTGYIFKIKFTNEYEDTQENLGRGYTQFAALGAVSYIKANKDYGVKIIVRGLNKENKAEYQAIIFIHPDSDIKHQRTLLCLWFRRLNSGAFNTKKDV